jgi:glycosyl transferase family 25
MVEAVDGRTLDFRDPGTSALIAPSVLTDKVLLPNQIANLLSHLRVYQQILADGQDHAIVLEDDVKIPADLGMLADAIAGQLTEAEIALLNFDSKDTCRLTREGAVQLPGGRLLALPIDVNQPVSGAGYIITRKACERMTKLLPVRAKVDDWAYRYHEGMLDRVRCVVPLAITKSPDFGSTIERHPAGSLKPHMLALVTRYDPGFFGKLIAYRRQLIWRSWTRVELVDMPFTEKPSRLD